MVSTLIRTNEPRTVAMNTMDTIQQIRALTNNDDILAFADYVVAARGDRSFTALDSIDLMKIPRLVTRVFIADFRNGFDDGILIKFSGRHIDQYFGQNIQGKYLDDVYNGSDGIDFVRNIYWRCHANGEICFRKRSSQFEHRILGQRDVLQKFILFPCSADDVTVDHGIGLSVYADKVGDTEDTLVFI